MTEMAAILDGLADYVRLLEELGERTVEIDPEIWAAWTASADQSVTHPASRPESTPSTGAGGAMQTFLALGNQSVAAETPAFSSEARQAELAKIAEEIRACSACPLREHRTNAVPGQGNPDSPDVMFIGEAPGADEDAQGLAFVGAAGQLLTKMIRAMGYTREEVFIANICKCRPPRNRTPTPEEMRVCFPFLKRQLAVIQPKTIILLGGTAIKAILNTQRGVTRLQGQWSRYEGIPVMPTYHPAYVLRFERFGQTEELRKVKLEVWAALKKVMAFLGKRDPRLNKNKER